MLVFSLLGAISRARRDCDVLSYILTIDNWITAKSKFKKKHVIKSSKEMIEKLNFYFFLVVKIFKVLGIMI